MRDRDAATSLLAGLFLMTAMPAAGAEVNPPPAPAETKEADPVVCKRTQSTGTRLGSQRICMTRSQWDIQRRELEELQRRQGEIRPNAPG